MGIAVRDEGNNVSANINVTPMVDVMLVLLIIFMVITPMLQNKVSVDMAKVDNPTSMPDADKEDAIVVAITRDGGVFLGQDKIAVSELGARVRDKIADKPGKTIFVRADARAQFAPWKTRSMRCVRRAWMKWACSRRSVKARRAAGGE